jgi:hypothetical protein
MIIGMFLHVWSATRRLDHTEWWNPDSMVGNTHKFSPQSLMSFGLGCRRFYHRLSRFDSYILPGPNDTSYFLR